MSTVVQEGWSGVKNGALMRLAAQRFDVLVTVDKNLSYQQRPDGLTIAVLVRDDVSNDLDSPLPLVPALERELSRIHPGRCVRVTSAA